MLYLHTKHEQPDKDEEIVALEFLNIFHNSCPRRCYCFRRFEFVPVEKLAPWLNALSSFLHPLTHRNIGHLKRHQAVKSI